MDATRATTNTSAFVEAATLLPNAVGRLPARLTVTLSNRSVSTEFLIKKGAGASATNFDFPLGVGQVAYFDDWQGIVTCFPTPSVDEMMVSEGNDA